MTKPPAPVEISALPPLLTPQEVARRLAISVDSVIRLIYSGQLPAALISKSPTTSKRRYRVRPEDMETFIESRMVRPRPPRQPKRADYVRHV